MAVKHLKSRTRAFFEKAFPERQIYHRSGGSVRYVSISPWRQAMMAGAATLIVGWCLFATVAVLLRGPALDIQGVGSDRKNARMERDLRQALAREKTALTLLETRTEDFNSAIKQAEDRHKTLKRLLASLEGQDSASAVALNGDDADLLVDSTIEEGDPRQSRPDAKDTASNETAGFRGRTNKLINEQAQFLDAAEDEAVERAERARGVIRLTGVSASKVLEQSGMGGPMIPVSTLDASYSADAADPFKRRVYEVEARLEEAQQYENAIHALPLGAPVEAYRETSGFGYRSDPFNRKTAFHEGADLASRLGAPIVATAPGTITYAGMRGTYGRVVEIDHGGGFKTRYGHMNSISVTTGAKVAIGQKIGTMG
ncbi:MAG TPA: peptidoglycan DD-metalloendopeptidase family protein, partial [Hyphomonadaceae bacterium]|nr:peptidoglycan DD-metalloendopeptidase family protein [Hyphomonadaceae bacterium]